MLRSRLEDTIIFYLIERLQFPLNAAIYRPGAIKLPGSHLSLFDWILRESEKVHSLVRRYEAPDEHPFFPDALEKPILQPLVYPKILHPNDVNVNQEIKRRYIEAYLPSACRDFGREDRGETKENYGSAATCDVTCLQSLSRRIHFGKFVAEAKFQSETDRFVELIRKGDRPGIDAAITNRAVEAQVLERLRLKAKMYGTDPADEDSGLLKITVDAVVSMYKVSFEQIHVAADGTGNGHTIDQKGGSRVSDAETPRNRMGAIEQTRGWEFSAFDLHVSQIEELSRNQFQCHGLVESSHEVQPSSSASSQAVESRSSRGHSSRTHKVLQVIDRTSKFGSLDEYHVSLWLDTEFLKRPFGICLPIALFSDIGKVPMSLRVSVQDLILGVEIEDLFASFPGSLFLLLLWSIVRLVEHRCHLEIRLGDDQVVGKGVWLFLLEGPLDFLEEHLVHGRRHFSGYVDQSFRQEESNVGSISWLEDVFHRLEQLRAGSACSKILRECLYGR